MRGETRVLADVKAWHQQLHHEEAEKERSRKREKKLTEHIIHCSDSGGDGYYHSRYTFARITKITTVTPDRDQDRYKDHPVRVVSLQ